MWKFKVLIHWNQKHPGKDISSFFEKNSPAEWDYLEITLMNSVILPLLQLLSSSFINFFLHNHYTEAIVYIFQCIYWQLFHLLKIVGDI